MALGLTEVMIQELDSIVGTSRIGLIVGDKAADSKLSIDAGAISIHITIPRSLGAQLTIDSALSTKNLINFEQIDAQPLESDNYDISDKKFALTLDIGVSSLDIDWK